MADRRVQTRTSQPYARGPCATAATSRRYRPGRPGIEVDGVVQVAETTWAIYGHTIYDGEVIVGEYPTPKRRPRCCGPRHREQPDEDRPGP